MVFGVGCLEKYFENIFRKGVIWLFAGFVKCGRQEEQVLGKRVKKVFGGKGGFGAAIGTALAPGIGTVAGHAASKGKFVQTTWNRLNGDGGRKKRGAVAGGDAVSGGDGALSAADGDEGIGGYSDVSGALTDAKRRGSTLVGHGESTFGGGLGE